MSAVISFLLNSIFLNSVRKLLKMHFNNVLQYLVNVFTPQGTEHKFFPKGKCFNVIHLMIIYLFKHLLIYRTIKEEWLWIIRLYNDLNTPIAANLVIRWIPKIYICQPMGTHPQKSSYFNLTSTPFTINFPFKFYFSRIYYFLFFFMGWGFCLNRM